MRLADALRVSSRSSCAFVGAGGKSALMGRLAAELAAEIPVVLTTTTRLALHQRQLATDHLILEDRQGIPGVQPFLEHPGSILITGRIASTEPKWLGLELSVLESVRKLVGQAGGVLLVEADGARGRSLKAPAEHEPVIPSFSDLVVLVAGLDVVGQRLSSDYVHRPERIAAILGRAEDSPLTASDVAAVLRAGEGGLQAIPRAADVRVVLNKADDETRQAAGRQVAQGVLQENRVRAVVLASAESSRVVREVIGRVAGVVLAAGGSRRMGRSKQLIPWRGKPLVWHAVRTALEAGLSPVVVVLGEQADRVREAIAGEGVSVVRNAQWEQGQSTSVQAGLAAVQRVAEAVVFLLCDTPFVTPQVIRTLVHEHRQTLTPIVAPRIEERWANPVLFDRVTFEAFSTLRGDLGGRALFERFRMAGISADPRIGLDVDTTADLRRLEEAG